MDNKDKCIVLIVLSYEYFKKVLQNNVKPESNSQDKKAIKFIGIENFQRMRGGPCFTLCMKQQHSSI